MPLIKLGEATVINPEDLLETSEIISKADEQLNERMKKFAQELKMIAPQASDFLYFTAVMMHAAEASLLDDDGNLRKNADGSDVSATWDKVGNDSIRWNCSDPSIRPYKNSNCLVPGTDILMGDGSRKAIEDIKVGDEVFTHKGRVKKVVNVFEHDNNSQIFNIKSKYHSKISLTSEHPFFAIAGSGKKLAGIKQGGYSPSWVKAEDISAGDYLTSLGKLDVKVDSDLTPNQARLLGYFAAEGSFSKKYGKRQAVVLTFNYSENYLTSYIEELVAEEFPECSVKVRESKSRQIRNVIISGKGIAEWFYEHTGEYAHDKKLSKELVFGSSEVKRQFLLGWIEGDGCITTGNKLVGISVSADMSWQIWLMLKSLGASVGIRKIDKCKRFIQIDKSYKEYECRPHYRIEIYGKNAEFICGNDSKKYKLEDLNHKDIDISLLEKYTIHHVGEVDVQPYEGKVYNFEVEDDHSYVANGLIVHNSDIFPESELKKAYQKWVGRPLCLDHKSSSVDMIRGVIVDTYWDSPRKRIIALCALDKKNYPDLARKVSSGYATNVSMGTAVGRAVCTEEGCHRVARVESDFCDHMRKRSCYGEVNLDLSPIELSLVVTGADPKAKVKHVIAKDLSEAKKAASALQDYLDGKIALASAEDDAELGYIKDELAKLNDRVAKLASSLEEADAEGDNNDAVGPTSSTAEFKDELLQDGQPLSAPEETASYAGAIEDARSKLSSINQTLNKLSKLSSLHNSEGSTMTNREKTAWWQGTEEPTPGKPQYPVDPGEAQARPQDKHMVGQSPFPEVGPVDGMHPGYESYEEANEEERKRRLQRLAEAERREQIRRAAVEQAKKELESKGWFQGTEEPTPAGKPQYPVDPGEGQARPQDKHMVGEKPFPEVGKVDGLYGDDLATKEKLSRASLKATFKKAKTEDGQINKSGSSWSVYAGDHLILTASVDEITRGNADTVYDAVATKDFGKSMIKKIVDDGFEAARTQFKGAQDMAAAPAAGGAPAGTPADEGEPVAEPVVDAVEPAEDSVEEVLNKAQDSISKAISMLGEGEGAVEEDAAGLGDITSAPREEEGFSKSSVSSMRKTVNAMLGEGFKEVIATLKAHKSEIDTAKTVLATKYSTMDPQQKAYFLELVDQAVTASKKTTEGSKELMEAFVRYAQGTEAALRKEAEGEGVPVITPEGTPEPETQDTSTEEWGGAPVEDVFNTEGVDEKKVEEIFMADDKDKVVVTDESGKKTRDLQGEADKATEEDKVTDIEDLGDRVPSNYQGTLFQDFGQAEDGVDVKDLPSGSTVDIDSTGEATVTIASDKIDLTTKEGRAMYRTKLAQKGVQFSDMLNKAHPQGGATPEDIAKPEGDLLKVERIDEVSKAMNDLANMPPKVRKQAQEIVQLVNEGKIAKDEVDQLVALGVDKDAVSYYKQYFAEAKDSESNEFAKLLTQEKMKASAAADLEAQTVKIKRAHDLAYQMRDKGMIETSQIPQQVDEILSWNDEGFSSVKNIVAKQEVISKTASVPQVGMLHSEELYLPSAAPAAHGGSTELSAVLEAHFAGKRL